MDIYTLDGLNGAKDVISEFQSVIWNMQYNGYGDFQLIMPATLKNMGAVTVGTYLVRDIDISQSGFNNVMIVEQLELSLDVENGWTLTATGRGLKSILSRRVVWEQISVENKLELIIYRILVENVSNPEESSRKIDNFSINGLKGYEDVASIQLYGENIGDWLCDITNTYDWGWDIYISDGNYVFELYKGTDRTFNQTNVTPVVFSAEYDNLYSSKYTYNIESYKNAALIGGEGEGESKRMAYIGDATGLDRYEAYIDGSGVSSNGEIITEQEYERLLEEFGKNEIAQTQATKNFTGDINPNGLYKINEDFFLGDLVQITNELGISSTSRIIEIIYAEDDTGTSIVPTFSEWEVNE